MLVGPAPRVATEGIFHWGQAEMFRVVPGTEPLDGGVPRAARGPDEGFPRPNMRSGPGRP